MAKATGKEKMVCELIAMGVLKIHDDWSIWRYKIKKRGEESYIDIIPRCIEKYWGRYKMINIRINGCLLLFLSHRVIYCWHHGYISKYLTINHIDGIKTNNNINNLELVTLKENIQHAHKIGLSADVSGQNNPMYGHRYSDQEKIKKSQQYIINKVNVGEKNGQSKLTNIQRTEIKTYLANGVSTKDLSRRYNVSMMTIQRLRGTIADKRAEKRRLKHGSSNIEGHDAY